MQTEHGDAARTAARAKLACPAMAAADTATKNKCLMAVMEALEASQDLIFRANSKDMDKARAENLPAPLLKRLKFDEAKLKESIEGILSVMKLPDPVRRVLSSRRLDTGLDLYQVTCPIGLVAMIFESRPDALIQMSSLALKSGNCLMAKGGREALETNRVLSDIIASAGERAGLPPQWLTNLETRDDVDALLSLHGTVDLIIPRGSSSFVGHIMRNTLIPVMGHSDGICHVYVDQSADTEMAVDIVVDSKTQYPVACNAAETLLVHAASAKTVLPALGKALAWRKVELRACERSLPVLREAGVDAVPASDTDWDAEYLDYVISVKIVDSLPDAVSFVNRHGSHHTDAIVTRDAATAKAFMEGVDSASVFWNASTRFADGFRYGLGAEVGISTGKLHARGPVGLEGLVTYKYKLFGTGQTVSDYSGECARKFLHENLDATKEPS